MTIHVNNESRKKFKCDVCGKDYLYPSSLRKHKEIEHSQQKQEEEKKEKKPPIKLEFEETKEMAQRQIKEEINIEDLVPKHRPRGKLVGI